MNAACHTVRHNGTRRVTDDRSHASPDQTRPDQSSLLLRFVDFHTPAPARHLSDGAPFARQERANGE